MFMRLFPPRQRRPWIPMKTALAPMERPRGGPVRASIIDLGQNVRFERL
jgi:hypothetical protein